LLLGGNNNLISVN